MYLLRGERRLLQDPNRAHLARGPTLYPAELIPFVYTPPQSSSNPTIPLPLLGSPLARDGAPICEEESLESMRRFHVDHSSL